MRTSHAALAAGLAFALTSGATLPGTVRAALAVEICRGVALVGTCINIVPPMGSGSSTSKI